MPDVFGTPGDDPMLLGTASNDRIFTGTGVDNVDAGGGDDQVYSVDADGVLDGGSGIDTIRLYRADSATGFTIDMSSGGNVADIGDGTEIRNFEKLYFIGGAGDDVITGGNLEDTIFGGGGNDILRGGGGSDRLFGGAGDQLYGDAGSDRISIDSTAAFIDGGTGNDIVEIAGKNVVIDSDFVKNVENFQIIDGNSVDFSDYERIVRVTTIQSSGLGVSINGGQFSDVIIGGNGNDLLKGNGGADRIEGGFGDDTIVGGQGNDILLGGEGNDKIFSNKAIDGPDTIDGGNGVDFALIDRTLDTVASTIDIKQMTSTLGDGTIVTSIEQLTYEGGFGDDVIKGGDLADKLSGGGGNDIIWGRGGGDILNGDAGDDVLVGGTGFDIMRGGSGNDKIYSNKSIDGPDVIDGGDDTDFALIDRTLATAGSTIDIQKAISILADGTIVRSIEQLEYEGGSGNDTIKGGDLADKLSGGAGDDIIYGRDGDDILAGNAGNDHIYGGEGTDEARYSETYSDASVVVTQLSATSYSLTVGGFTDILDSVENVRFGGQVFAINTIVDI